MKRHLLTLFTMLSCCLAGAQDGIFVGKPYLQNPSGNGITIVCNTSVPAYSWVEYGTDSTQMRQARTMTNGQAQFGQTTAKIRLEGITRGKTWYYRVCSHYRLDQNKTTAQFGEMSISPCYSFRLPELDEENFTAVVFNDLHNNSELMEEFGRQLVSCEFDFSVINGDCISQAATKEDALKVLTQITEMVHASEKPMLFVRGNHETRFPFYDRLPELFDYEEDILYGAFSWGKTRIIYLDSGEPSNNITKPYVFNDFDSYRNEQLSFLRKEAASFEFADASRRIIIAHAPLYTFPGIFESWYGTLSALPVDLCFGAHVHNCKFYPTGSLNGNPWPLAVGGGKTSDDASVMILSKEGSKMSVKARRVDGKTVFEQDLPKSPEAIHITAPVGEETVPYIEAAERYLRAENEPYIENYDVDCYNPFKSVKIAWTNSYNDVSGFNVTYATLADYSDGKTVTTDWMTFSIELFNLLKDTTYHVRISPIIKGKDICVESTFRTSALGPRVMNIPNLYNVRDLGGYRTVSGKRTRQGMVFRGSELNDPTCGMLLTAEGERYLSEELKIKSDMDLRKEKECGGISVSPIPSAKLTIYDAGAYGHIFEEAEAEKYRKIFSAFASEDNYPFYVHCKQGADRTGTVCFLLNALLGVSEGDLVNDFEFTSFSHVGLRTSQGRRWQELVNGLQVYDGKSISEKVESFLLSIGVKRKEINSIRKILLEP